MQMPYAVLTRMGAPQRPPFRSIGKDAEMLESYPSYYWVVGQFIHPLRLIRNDMSKDTHMEIVASAMHGCEMFLRYRNVPAIWAQFDRSMEKADVLQKQLKAWSAALTGTPGEPPIGAIEDLRKIVTSFSISFQDELDRIKMFTVTPKGNLDVVNLVAGASQGYPKRTLECLDSFIKNEIDHAGKCLAFELPTASGFHILRGVEISAKAYVYAATGGLPGIKNRNWGEYIFQLEGAGAHSDVTDVLKILKTKRNPLMHPQDDLEIDEAIGLLCICQSAIEALIDDVRTRSLEVKFKDALKALPTL